MNTAHDNVDNPNDIDELIRLLKERIVWNGHGHIKDQLCHVAADQLAKLNAKNANLKSILGSVTKIEKSIAEQALEFKVINSRLGARVKELEDQLSKGR